MQDPVADFITQIRNALSAGKQKVLQPASKLKLSIAKVLKEEGYIDDYQLIEINDKKNIEIKLKYYMGSPVISTLKRISKPSIRIYKSYKKINKVRGFGIAILSTSRGIMTDKQAKEYRVGGEIICEVS